MFKKKCLATVLLWLTIITATLGLVVCGTQFMSATAETATPVKEWSDGTTTYTFDSDINGWYCEDVGDMNANLAVSTEAGYTKPTADRGNYNATTSNLYANDAWGHVGSTGGMAFSFKTSGAWNTGDGVLIEFVYGDIIFEINGYDNGNTVIYVTSIQSDGNKFLGWVAYDGVFTQSYEMADWVTFKLSRIKCTNATGYWMKYSLILGGDVSVPVDGTLAESVFVPYAMNPRGIVCVNNVTGTDLAIRRADGNYLDESNFEAEVSHDISELNGDLSFVAGKTMAAVGNNVLGGIWNTSDEFLCANGYHVYGANSYNSTFGMSFSVAPADGQPLTGTVSPAYGAVFNQQRLYFDYDNGSLYLRCMDVVSHTDNGVYGVTGNRVYSTKVLLSSNFDTSKTHTFEFTRRKVNGDTSTDGVQGSLVSVYIDRYTENEIKYQYVSGYYFSEGFAQSFAFAKYGKEVVLGNAYLKSEEEVYQDIADWSKKNEYIKMATGYDIPDSDRWAEPSMNMADNKADGTCGVEFTFKPSVTCDNSGLKPVMSFRLGTFVMVFNLTDGQRESYNGLLLETFHNSNSIANNLTRANIVSWNPTNGNNDNHSWGVKPIGVNGEAEVFSYGKEYVIRVTAIKSVLKGVTQNSRFIKLYMGAVDETTGKPNINWDSAPVAMFYDTNTDFDSDRDFMALLNDVNVADTIHIESPKYAAACLSVNGVETVEKFEKGQAYTVTDKSTSSMIVLGWAYNIDKPYSEDNFIANGTELVLNQSIELQAICLKIEAQPKAKLRFLLEEDGSITVALKWNITIDEQSLYYLGEYFKDAEISFGCKMWTGAGDSTDVAVSNFAKNGNYSLIQSGITADYKDVRFALVPYVQVDGVKYYCTDDVAELTSIAALAEAALADVQTEQYGIYVNEVKTGVYSYLTAAEYSALSAYANASEG